MNLILWRVEPDHTWFLDLNIKRAKDFYRILEDIWNYRAELTNQRKGTCSNTKNIQH